MGSSRTRARTRVPCIGRRILNHWATREVQKLRSLIWDISSLLTQAFNAINIWWPAIWALNSLLSEALLPPHALLRLTYSSERVDSGARLPWQYSWLCHLVVVWTCTSYLTSLSLFCLQNIDNNSCYLWWLILCVNLGGPCCPDIWSNIILDVAMRVFLDEINI